MLRSFIITMTGLILVVTGCATDTDPTGGSGLIEASESVVSAETSGQVVFHNFDEGSRVTAGDTLVIIDPSRLTLELAAVQAGLGVIKAQLITAALQVNQAETAESFAKSELERADQLLVSGTITQRLYDKAVFDSKQAGIARQTASAQVATLTAQAGQVDANLDRIMRQLADCYALAPISGVITEKFVEPGELLTPGKAIARIARLDPVTVKVYLTTDRFAGVKIGDQAEVSTESGGQTFVGTIVWTSDEAEFTPKNVQTEQARADLVYAVKLSIDNPDRTLKIGMPVFVTLEN